MGDILIVTAYKDIGRSNWVGFERSSVDYSSYFLNLANTIEYTLVVYVENDIFDYLQNAKLRENIIIKNLNEVDTFYNRFIDKDRQIMMSDEYQSKIPECRKIHPEHRYAEYNMITNSKVNFVKHTKDLLPNYKFYAWIDFGKINENSENFPINIDINLLPTSKITCHCIEEPPCERISDEDLLRIDNVYFLGSYFIVPKILVDFFEQKWCEKIIEWQAKNITDDDQSALYQIYCDISGIFHKIYAPWYGMFRVLRCNVIKNQYTFTNDDFVNVFLLDHPYSEWFKTRDDREVIFRRINTFLIKNKIIKNNIIDLGAWIGDNSIPWAKNIDGVVYAIDPSPNNCNFINKMCELNNITNVLTIKSAISNINELLTTNEDLFHCSFVYNNSGLNGIYKVNAVSLNYLYDNGTIKNIGYMHLDVEGMEYKIIEGSSKIIDECRPIISFEQHLEIDDYDIIAVHLKNKEYSIFLIDEVLPTCRHDCRNSFAFPNEIYNEELIINIHNYIGKDILIPK